MTASLGNDHLFPVSSRLVGEYQRNRKWVMLVRDTGVFSEFGAEDHEIALIPPFNCHRHTHTHTSLPHRSSPTSCWRRDFYVARRTHGNEGKMKRHKGPGPVRAHVASFETRNVSRRSDRKHDIPEYLIPCCWISSLLRFCYDHNNNHLNYIFFQ